MFRLASLCAIALAGLALCTLSAGCGSGAGEEGLCAPGLPSDVPLSGMIIFASTRDFNSEIYYYHPAVEGGEKIALRLTLTNEANPALSPDGSRIALNSNWNDTPGDGNLSDDEIWIVGGDCTTLAQLTVNERQDLRPRFSPDGNWIVYQSSAAYSDDRNSDVWIMRTDGTDATRLTDETSQDYSPSFRPDGRRIIFSRRLADDSADGFGDTVEIWTMDLTGGDLQQVTPSDDGYSALYAAFSPDATRIAYAAQPPNEAAGIWVANADGTSPVQLTPPQIGGSGATRPSWSPDGQWIVYDQFSQGLTAIYMVSSVGGDAIKLTQGRSTEGSDTSPFYSPVP